MVFSWLLAPLRQRARAALLATPFPSAWLDVLRELPFYRQFDERGPQLRARQAARFVCLRDDYQKDPAGAAGQGRPSRTGR